MRNLARARQCQKSVNVPSVCSMQKVGRSAVSVGWKTSPEKSASTRFEHASLREDYLNQVQRDFLSRPTFNLQDNTPSESTTTGRRSDSTQVVSGARTRARWLPPVQGATRLRCHAKQHAHAGRDGHRQCAPEGYSHNPLEDARATGVGCQRTQNHEEQQRSRSHHGS